MEELSIKDAIVFPKRPIRERRRWAKAKSTFELGLWGYDLEYIKGVELTTWADFRNNWDVL